MSALFLVFHLSEISKDFHVEEGFSSEWEVQMQDKSKANLLNIFSYQIKKPSNKNNEFYIKPKPSKKIKKKNYQDT